MDITEKFWRFLEVKIVTDGNRRLAFDRNFIFDQGKTKDVHLNY